jgi:hypothetical protein
LGLAADAFGASVEFSGQVHGQCVCPVQRGSGGFEVVDVGGDDAAPQVGVEAAAAVREVAGQRDELPGVAPAVHREGECLGERGQVVGDLAERGGEVGEVGAEAELFGGVDADVVEGLPSAPLT